MTNLIPAIARTKIERFRDSLGEFLDRCRSGRNNADLTRPSEDDYWPSRILETGHPDIDMEDRGDKIEVTIELPGLEPKDVQLWVQGRKLLIRGEKKQKREEKSRGAYYSECRYGSFSRWLTLPCEVEVDEAKTRYKRGVLRLDLPKTEQARAKTVEVKVH